jgi:hypothetical protein
MNALRIRKRLDAPIPQLPELTPLIGKDLEIIVLEDTTPPFTAKGNPWNPKSAQELAEERGIKPIQSIDQLQGNKQKPVARFEDLLGGWPEDQLDDGFEEAVDQWRREPWRSEDPLKDFDESEVANG